MLYTIFISLSFFAPVFFYSVPPVPLLYITAGHRTEGFHVSRIPDETFADYIHLPIEGRRIRYAARALSHVSLKNGGVGGGARG